MDSFIESKNNLEVFSKSIKDIERIINEGIEDYTQDKENTAKILGEEK